MNRRFLAMTVTSLAVLVGSGAIAQAVPLATSSQRLPAKHLLSTTPQSSQSLLKVPEPPPAFSTISICYGRCGGPADQLKLPNGGEVSRQDTQVPVTRILGGVQPFLGTPMDPHAIGAKVPLVILP
jgi:hypothetical protein